MADGALQERLAGLSGRRRELLDRLVARSGDQQHEVSQAQRGLWFIEQLQPGSPLYVVGWRYELHGGLDPVALARALTAVVARHQALRASFPLQDGRPVLRVEPEVTVALPVDNLSDLAPSEQEPTVAAIAADCARRGFDLRTAPLVRARLVRLAADRHVLILCLHHIVCDGVSATVLLRELLDSYAGEAGGPRPDWEPAVPYSRFVEWQREQLTQGRGQVLREFWRDRLAGAPALLEIPTGRTRPPAQAHHGATYRFVVGPDDVAAMAQLASAQRCSPFMAYLAVLQALLCHYSGRTDICVGTAAANRPHPDLQAIVGLCANMIVLRTDLSGDPTFRQLLDRVRGVCLDAYEHQDMPFDRLVEELAPDRSLAYNPLFQVACVLESEPTGFETAGAPALASMDVVPTGGAKFDLSFAGMRRGSEIAVTLEYRTDLFDEPVAAGMAAHFTALWRESVAHPDRPLSQLAVEPATTGPAAGPADPPHPARLAHPAELPGPGAYDLVREHADRRPAAVALRGDGRDLTYRALAGEVAALAGRLVAAGAGPGSTVGIRAPAAVSTVVALLAVAATGAVAGLVPAAASTGSGTPAESDPPAGPAADLQLVPDGGRELAVAPAPGFRVGTEATLVTPGTLARLAANAGDAWQLEPVDRVAVLGRPDGSWRAASRFLSEVLAGLAAGATCCLLPVAGTGPEPATAVRALLRDQEITAAWLPPRLWSLARAEAGRLRVVVTEPGPWRPGTAGGPGPGPARVVTGYLARHIGLSALTDHPGGQLSPVAGVSTRVLDEQLRPAPPGIAGDLYLAASDLPVPASGPVDGLGLRLLGGESGGPGVMVRTGDLACQRPDGGLVLLGPRSAIRDTGGIRLDPWATERAIAAHPDVADVAVTAATSTNGGALTAYVVAAGRPVGDRDLRAFLADRLPPHLLPSMVAVVDAVPLAADWSVDLGGLTSPCAPAPEHVPPRSALERVVVSVWQELFEAPRVGVEDNFFDLGGHSLLAVQMLGMLSQLFGVELPLSVLFGVPTPAALAERLAGLLGGAETAEQTAQSVEAILAMSDEEARDHAQRLPAGAG